MCALSPHCVPTEFFTSSSYRKGPLYTKTLWLWLLPLLLTRAGSQQAGGRNCSHQVRKPCNTISPHNPVFRTNLEQALLGNLARGKQYLLLSPGPQGGRKTEQDFPDNAHSGMKELHAGKPSSTCLLTLFISISERKWEIRSKQFNNIAKFSGL